MKNNIYFALILGVMVGTGCSKSTSNAPNGEAIPQFTLTWSEYPSWSVFGVADEQGLIDGTAGGLGELEKKHNVDIVLNLADYDTCITQYGASEADAVCITNMDIMGPSLKRSSVAVLPTSTSDGADACITVGIDGIDGLKGKTTFGLEKSVSQYCFERVLEMNGKDPAEFPFENMDPAAAATAMQTANADVESIIVWNPFVMQTLRDRKESKVLFDSSSIKEEIIDMVVVAQDSLKKPGGQRFVYALMDAFYQVNDMIAAEETREETLIALGSKFSKLGLEDMEEVVKQTKFYNSVDAGIALMQSEKFQNETMPAVADFLVEHDMADEKPSFGFDSEDAQLNFSTKFLTEAQSGALK